MGLLKYALIKRHEKELCHLLDYYTYQAFEKTYQAASAIRKETFYFFTKYFIALYTMGTFTLLFFFTYPLFLNDTTLLFPIAIYFPFEFGNIVYWVLYGFVIVSQYTTCFLNGITLMIFSGIIICLGQELKLLAVALEEELSKEELNLLAIKAIVDRHNNNHG
jgi:hypothetical protein